MRLPDFKMVRKVGVDVWYTGCTYMCIGHYRALEWNEKEQTYLINEELGILVEVDVSRSLSLSFSSLHH